MAEVSLKDLAIEIGTSVAVVGIVGLGFVVAVGIVQAVVGLL